MVSIEPPQTILHAAHQVFAMIASKVQVSTAVAQRIFGSYHKMIAVFSDEVAHKFFRCTLRIAIGGINKVAPGIRVGIKDLLADFFVTAPFPLGAKAHGAETKF